MELPKGVFITITPAAVAAMQSGATTALSSTSNGGL